MSLTHHIINTHSAMVLLGFLLTLLAYFLGKFSAKLLPQVPVIVSAMIWVIVLLLLFSWDYDDYMGYVDPLFNRLLGYVTVALAIPLAAMRFNDLPLKPIIAILSFATTSAVAIAVGLAYLAQLPHETLLAFTARAVTTPVALNIAALIHAPLATVSLIVILSGVIGAAFSPWLLKNIQDERAAGLALGLSAHAIGTVQAWQRSMVAGRYAAFGMAVNAVVTSIWLPILFLALGKI